MPHTLQDFVDKLDFAVNDNDHPRTMLTYHPEISKYYTIEVHPGKLFDKLVQRTNDNSQGGYIKYFVERSTGNIYGAESFNKPNFKRQFGTLSTVDDWDWRGYYAVSLKGIDTLVPKELRRK